MLLNGKLMWRVNSKTIIEKFLSICNIKFYLKRFDSNFLILMDQDFLNSSLMDIKAQNDIVVNKH